MGFFDRFNREKETAPPSDERSLVRLFETHAGASSEKQLALAAFLGGRDPKRLDLEHALIDLDDGQLRVQVIGIEDPGLGAFRWAWSMDDVPSIARRGAEALKRAGNAVGAAELSRSSVPLLRLPGEIAATIAVGVANASGAIAMPRGEARMWLAIEADQIPVASTRERTSAERISRTMTEMLRLLDLFRFDVFTAFTAYVDTLSLAVTKIPNGLECRVGEEKVVAMKKLPTAEQKAITAAPSVGYSFPVSRIR